MEHARITKNNDRTHTYQIAISSEVFKPTERVAIDIGDDYIKIRSTGIDFLGKTHAMGRWSHTKCTYFTTVSKEVKMGRYELDPEETNEDQVVFYLNE